MTNNYQEKTLENKKITVLDLDQIPHNRIIDLDHIKNKKTNKKIHLNITLVEVVADLNLPEIEKINIEMIEKVENIIIMELDDIEIKEIEIEKIKEIIEIEMEVEDMMIEGIGIEIDNGDKIEDVPEIINNHKNRKTKSNNQTSFFRFKSPCQRSKWPCH